MIETNAVQTFHLNKTIFSSQLLLLLNFSELQCSDGNDQNWDELDLFSPSRHQRWIFMFSPRPDTGSDGSGVTNSLSDPICSLKELQVM